MRLDYVVLTAADLGALRDWYVDVIGLSTVHGWDSDDFVMLAGDDGARQGLHPGEPLANPSSVQVSFRVEDVDAWTEELDGAGVEVLHGPETEPWGYRTTVVEDPAGHTVEFFQVVG